MGTLRIESSTVDFIFRQHEGIILSCCLICTGLCSTSNRYFRRNCIDEPRVCVGQECIEIQKTCLAAATTGIQKVQCWVQFGVCFGSRLLGCYKKCVPPLQECQATAGKDWIKIFQCGAAYIKCVTQDCA